MRHRWLVPCALTGILLVVAGVRLAPQAPPTAHLMFVARDGAKTMICDVPGDAFSPRLSPDGRQVSFESRGSAWVADLGNLDARRPFKPLPVATFPVWRDATHLLFIGMQGHPSLYSAAVGGVGGAELLADVARAPDGWSDANDGASFITLTGGDYDIWFYSARTKQVTPLVVIRGSRQLSSQISPDGKWLAYKSDETGAFEVWVQPFPTGPRTRVTTGGGRNPRWSPDGRELIYDDDRRLLAMPLKSESPLTFGAPQALPITGFAQAPSLRRQWDVAADGRLLVMER